MEMEIPVIDLEGLNGDAGQRSQTMARLHEACKDWGFFWVSISDCTFSFQCFSYSHVRRQDIHIRQPTKQMLVTYMGTYKLTNGSIPRRRWTATAWTPR